MGVFHNDVIAVGDRDLLFIHAQAFVDTEAVVTHLRRLFAAVCGQELRIITTQPREVPLDEAVRTYLFNSQIVRDATDQTVLIAPVQCRDSDMVGPYIDSLTGSDGPFDRVLYVDLLQSMRNGGGPACLRLRVALTAAELRHVHSGVMFTDALYQRLVQWVHRHYREQLSPIDLADPKLLTESRDALEELTRILELGPVYPFQQTTNES